MELTVTGLDETRPLFKHLWGRYVLGVKPATHCIQGLKTIDVRSIRPTMRNGTYSLRDDLGFFYLCGVGMRDLKADHPMSRRHTNVHLAVIPRKGSVASLGSVYGAVFTITDAEAIGIQPLPEDFAGLPEPHYRCKNFQFAYQVFDVSAQDCHVKGKLIEKRRLPYAAMSIG